MHSGGGSLFSTHLCHMSYLPSISHVFPQPIVLVPPTPEALAPEPPVSEPPAPEPPAPDIKVKIYDNWRIYAPLTIQVNLMLALFKTRV